MVTAREFIQNPTSKLWAHGLEILRHTLKGDWTDTAFKHPLDPYSSRCLDEMRAELERHMDRDREFDELVERTNFRAKRRVSQWDDSGDLEVGAYIDREELCFVDWPKMEAPQQKGITILIDAAVPWCDRDENYMVEGHKKAYEIAVQAEADGVPCRVVAVYSVAIPEFAKPSVRYIVIKDFHDPIFPGIWGALKSNKTTNNLINTTEDYLVGTRAPGNGSITSIYSGDEFAEDDVIVIEPATRIKCAPGHLRR